MQKAHVSYSNDGEEEISDLIPNQQAGTSGINSFLATPDKVIERIDDPSDQTYDDHLVGKKICGNYGTAGWHNGKIEYFNTKLKEYLVLFDDGSSDYIKEDDIGGDDIILLDDDLATKRKSGGKVRHKFSSKGRIIKSTPKQTAPKILKQKNKMWSNVKKNIKIEIEAVDDEENFSDEGNPELKISGILLMTKEPKLASPKEDVLEETN